jgi:hypothetical protein
VNRPRKYALQVRKAWLQSGGAADRIEEWSNHLRQFNTHEFMTPADRTFFNSLSDEFTVYRGIQNSSPNGISWTTSREVAEGFVCINPRLPVGRVVEKRIKKSQVFAALATDEHEIIILKTS